MAAALGKDSKLRAQYYDMCSFHTLLTRRLTINAVLPLTPRDDRNAGRYWFARPTSSPGCCQSPRAGLGSFDERFF